MHSLFAKLKPGIKTLWAGVLSCSLVSAGALPAQSTETPPQGLGAPANVAPQASLAPPASEALPAKPVVDPIVRQVSGCASCGLPGSSGASSYGCSGNGCVPGRTPCHPCTSDTICGRLFGGLCDEFCCPDPCYEPRWIPEANAAFFQDSPRPVTQTRIRWDAGFRYNFPDSAEFFWAQINKKGPKFVTPSLHYNDLTLYQEIAAKGASVFVEMPYRTIDPINGPTGAGMGDMNVGVKTVLLDRELLLVSMQMRTFIPIGNPTTGLGTGHVALEPSLLAALKLTSSTYLQTELAEWIPLGGTPGFAGSVFHYHLSLNQNLCHYGECFNLVGTLEMNGYTFRGQFTDLNGAAVGLSGASYVNAGPGLRMQFCDRCDLGFGMAFGFDHGHGPAQFYRTELRIRF